MFPTSKEVSSTSNEVINTFNEVFTTSNEVSSTSNEHINTLNEVFPTVDIGFSSYFLTLRSLKIDICPGPCSMTPGSIRVHNSVLSSSNRVFYEKKTFFLDGFFLSQDHDFFDFSLIFR